MKLALRKVVSLLLFVLTATIGVLTAQPTFTSNPITTATVGSQYVYGVSATDPSNNVLNFSAITKPAWLTLNNNGQSSATQFGGTIPQPGGISGDDAGNIYVTSLTTPTIYKIAPDGTTTTWFTRQAGYVYGMYVYNNILYVSYYINNTTGRSKITKINLANPAAGETDVYVSPISNNVYLSMTYRAGFLYVAAYSQSKIVKINLSDNTISDVVAVSYPFGVGFNSQGILYIASYGTGSIYTFNLATSALAQVITGLQNPSDVKIDAYDNVYVSGYQFVRKYTPTLSSFVTAYTAPGYVWGMSITPTGALVFGDNGANRVAKLQTGASLTGTPALTDTGVHNITLRVSNGSATTDQNYAITVYSAPTIAAMANVSRPLNQGPVTITNPISNSNGAFTYTSSNPAVASVTGNSITLNTQGTTTITATQAALGYFNEGTRTFTLTVTAPVTVGPAGINNGIKMWLDASDIDGDGNTGNDPVNNASLTIWKDKSGAANHATTIAGKNGINYVTSQINGKAVARFTKVDDVQGSVMEVNGLDIRAAANPAITMFTVYKSGAHPAVSGQGHALWGNDDGSWDRFFYSAWSYTDDGIVSLGPVNPTFTNVTGSGTVGATRLLTAVYNNGVVNGSNIYFNGAVVNTFTDNTSPSAAKPVLGIGWDGDNGVYNGDIAEMIVYNRKLTDCEILTINQYLGAKYGVTFTSATITPAGPITVCAGTPVTLTASAGSSYQWYKDNVLIPSANASTYNATSSGSYTVNITSAAGCTASSAPVAVTVNSLPTATVVKADVTCSGANNGTITITANGGSAPYQYSINGGSSFVATNSFTGLTAGNYNVLVKSSAGCNSVSQVITIAVTPDVTVPVPTVATLPDITGQCAVTVTTVPTAIDNCSGILNATTNSPLTYTARGNYTITWQYTDAAGNQTTQTQQIIVQSPEINITGNGNTIASGNTVTALTDHTGFGGTVPNSPLSKTFTIQNTGTSDLVIASVNSNNASFTVSGLNFPAVIAAGQSGDIIITFNAATVGVQNATITINNNDCDEASYTFAIKAEIACTNPVFSNINLYIQSPTNANSCNAVVNYPLAVIGTPAPNVTYTFTGATTGSGTGTGSGQTFNTGITRVIVTATNACTTTTTQFDVTVVDNVKPVVVTKNINAYLNASGQVTINPADVNNGSTDNCGPVTLSLQNTGIICATAAEGQSLTLTAPAGTVITAINFASYGTPTGSCGNFILGTCHAPNTKAIVESLALNNNSVTISANNSLFGDPCGGTVKRLYITATYSGGSTPVNTFDCSKTGNNTVTLIVTDANGNSNTGTAVVTVLDTIKPVVITQNLTVNLNASGTANITAAQVNNGSTDNCGIATISVDKTTFNCSNVGANTVILTVTDVKGNVSTATATVTVVDNINPTAIAQPITVNLNASGTASITASQINNGSSDNCGIATISINKTNFDCSTTGANTVTLTVTDVNGNVSTATATVTVIDNTQPTITAPAGITVNTTVNCTATGVVLGTPVTADNCAVQSVTNNAPAVFPIGNTIVTWTVTDASGNTNTATQTVTVTDVTAPVPNVATLPNLTGECGVTVTTIPTATDNCSGTINATTTSPLAYNNQGTYTITWKYTDASGNISTQTQTVIVQDVTPPVVSCPAPITVTAPSNQCGATVTFNQPTVTDNCSSGNTGVHTLTSGAQFFDYANNVNETQYSPGLPMSFFPTDGQKLAVFLVSCGTTHYMYQDITLPASGPINLGMDMKYTNHNGSFSSSQFIAIELRNPITNALITTLFKTNPGALLSTPMTHYNFDLSAYAGQQVRLQVLDATINNFYLDVQMDNITIPGSSLVNGSFETGNYNGWTIGSASSSCGTFGIGSGPSVTIAQTAGLPSGSTFPIGTTTNTFEVTDLAGNKTTCSFNVTVNAPEISVSGNGTEIASGDNTASVADNTDMGGTIPGNSISKTFVIANNGTSALTINSINIGNASFTRSGISLPAIIQPGQTANFTISFASTVLGVQTAVVTVNNNDCNEGVYSFTVKAEVTCTNPVFVNTNAQVQANTTATTCNAVVNYPLAITGIPAPNVTYVFSGATTGSGTGTGSGQTFNKGTTHVTVTAVNPCSTVVNEFDVIVTDNILPIATSQNITVQLDASGTASITAAQVNNGSSDNCGIATISVSKTSFDCSNVGANTVTLTVTDVNGNLSTATAVVTVADNILPIATSQNITVQLDASGTATITAAQVNNGSSDNCGIATISVSKTSFDCSNVGANTVTLTVTDVNGNVSTATAVVTVVDNINPTITAPANITQGTDAGVCGATVNLGTPLTADNCSIATVTNNAPTLFPVGTTVVTWTVTDANGNSSTATQTVVVSDTEKPTITAPAMVSVVNTPGTCATAVNLGTPVTGDNCGVASVTNNAPALFPVGTTVVTWTVTDIHGNVTDTATQTVVVIDNENPTISVSNISVNNDAGKCGATVNITLPQTGDNCGVATVMGVRSDNKLLTEDYPVGTTTITWTVRDVNGNIKTATQTVVVTDNEKPVIVCAANQVFCANTGGNTQYTIAALNQSDNCGIATTTYTVTGATNRTGTGTNASGSFAIGTSTVTFTVRDIHGNTSTCSFTVTVNPLPVASISAASPDALCSQFTLTANSTLSGPYSYQWLYNNTTKATTQQLSLGLTDADGVYSVYTTDVNGCRSEQPATYTYQKQNLVSSYTILGLKEVKLGQYDKVETGSVGVMSSRGEAEFDKYSSVTGAGSFVKAPRIDTDKGVTINSKIYGIASVSLPTMQYNLSNTRYLQDKTVNSNVTATIAGNYDQVTLKKGSNVTLTGTVFGKIKLEEGASVSFTSTTIDVEEIQIEKGPKSGGYSYIRFAPNTSIRVSKKVTIGSDVIVNPEAYQVTFFMADNRRDEEKFHVKGDDTRITANIILPDGKLKVTGGNYGDDRCDHRPHSSNSCRHRGHGHHDCDHRGHGDRDCRDDVFMTGLFIAEEVESEGKNVIWNSYNCAAPSAPVTTLTSNNNTASVTEEKAASVKVQATSKSEEELKVTVMPNPTRTYFTLKLESKHDAPVTLRVVDAAGRVVDSRAKLGSNSTIQIGHNYHAGNYFAEFIQGNRRKTIQLIKVR